MWIYEFDKYMHHVALKKDKETVPFDLKDATLHSEGFDDDDLIHGLAATWLENTNKYVLTAFIKAGIKKQSSLLGFLRELMTWLNTLPQMVIEESPQLSRIVLLVRGFLHMIGEEPYEMVRDGVEHGRRGAL